LVPAVLAAGLEASRELGWRDADGSRAAVRAR
jgi:hypothetical protein